MPAFIAFFPGMLAGSLCVSLITHWIALLLSGGRRNPIDALLPTTGRSRLSSSANGDEAPPWFSPPLGATMWPNHALERFVRG